MDPSHVNILLFQVTMRKKLFQVSMVSGYLSSSYCYLFPSIMAKMSCDEWGNYFCSFGRNSRKAKGPVKIKLPWPSH